MAWWRQVRIHTVRYLPNSPRAAAAFSSGAAGPAGAALGWSTVATLELWPDPAQLLHAVVWVPTPDSAGGMLSLLSEGEGSGEAEVLVACADGLVVRVGVLPARSVAHADRRALATLLRQDIRQALGLD